MLNIILRSAAKLSVTLLLIASLIALAGPMALASDGSDKKNKNNVRQSRPTQNEQATEASRSSDATPQTLNISYALYNNMIKLEPEPEASTPKPGATPKPKAPAVSTAPMTVGEKFDYWLRKTILSPGAYGQSVFSGMLNELLDNDEGKKDTVENYFADSMTRAARSMAFRITGGFFEKFAYASIFRQDPRYHRSSSRSVGGKIGYAVSRLFVTQGDRCGCDQFNISYLAGGLTASFIANEWEREERATTSKALRRWGVHLGITALANILREFIGGQ